METVDLNFRFNATGNAVPELRKAQSAVKRLDGQIQQSNARMRGFNNGITTMQANTRKFSMGALQQAGYQVGDYAVQVANGTSKMQAFGQQAPQFLQIFGPIGAVVGAGVAIFAALGVAIERSGGAVGDLSNKLGVLKEPLVAAANSVKSLKASFGDALPVIANNIDTAIIAAGLFAGVVGAKMVRSMILSAGAGKIMAGAMVQVRAAVLAATLSAGKGGAAMIALRSATLLVGGALKAVGAVLMRFLPIAIFVGIAKLVEMFLQLRRGAGGFGSALGLLKDVAVEVFGRIRMAFGTVPLAIKAGSAKMSSFFLEKVADMSESFVDFTADVADSFNSLFNTNLTPLGSSMATSMRATSDAAIAAAEVASSELSSISNAVTAPLDSMAALRAAFQEGADDSVTWGSATEDAISGAASKINSELVPAMNRMQQVGDIVGSSMENAMMSVVEGTKSAKEAFKSMASEIIKELYRVFVVKRITGFVSSMIADPAMFGGMGGTSPVNGSVRPVARSFAGGGYTGNGARAGGLDGKGGYMAMIHPRETVVDHTKGQAAGGVTVNQNITFGSGVSRAEVSAMIPKIVEATKAAVADAKLRGGSYGRSFA